MSTQDFSVFSQTSGVEVPVGGEQERIETRTSGDIDGWPLAPSLYFSSVPGAQELYMAVCGIVAAHNKLPPTKRPERIGESVCVTVECPMGEEQHKLILALAEKLKCDPSQLALVAVGMPRHIHFNMRGIGPGKFLWEPYVKALTELGYRVYFQNLFICVLPGVNREANGSREEGQEMNR